jgi:hypothetical protein
MVAASGSWVADSPGIIADFPIQTSDIVCFRDSRTCTEARAYLNPSTKNLIAQALFYSITAWTEAEVTATFSRGPKATNMIEIRFDRVKHTFTMSEAVRPPDASQSRYDAHLDDGDKIFRRLNH